MIVNVQFAHGVSWSFFSHHCFWLLDLFFKAMSPSLEQTSPLKVAIGIFYFRTSIRLCRLNSGAYTLCWPSEHWVMKLYSERTRSWWWWCDKTMACMLWAIEVEGRLSHVRQRETFWRTFWTVSTSNVSISGRPWCRYSNQKLPSYVRKKIC